MHFYARRADNAALSYHVNARALLCVVGKNRCTEVNVTRQILTD